MGYFTDNKELFGNKDFLCFFANCLLTNLAFGFIYVILIWLGLYISNHVSYVALLMFCFWVPIVLLGPYIGVVVDRHSRKTILAVVNVCFMVAIAIFALCVNYYLNIYVLGVSSFVFGSLLGFYSPASGVLTRELVDEKILLSANTMVDVVYEVGTVLGMGLAGVLLIIISYEATAFLASFMYFMSAILILLIGKKSLTTTKKGSETRHHMIREMCFAINYLFKNKKLLKYFLIQMFIMVIVLTLPVLLAPYIKSVLSGNISEYAWLNSILSAGVIFGGIISPPLVMWVSLEVVVLCQMLLMTILLYVFSHCQILSALFVVYFVIGFCLSSWPLVLTQAQNHTDIEYQGRLQTVCNSLAGIVLLFVYMLIAGSGYYISIVNLYWIEIILVVLAVLLLLHDMRCSVREKN